MKHEGFLHFVVKALHGSYCKPFTMSLICLFLGDGRKGNGDLETSFLLHFLYTADKYKCCYAQDTKL